MILAGDLMAYTTTARYGLVDGKGKPGVACNRAVLCVWTRAADEGYK